MRGQSVTRLVGFVAYRVLGGASHTGRLQVAGGGSGRG